MRFRLLTFLILIALLSACGAETPTAEPSPVPSATAAVPTLTPTPTIPLAILILPPNLEPETSNLYQKTVYDLTQASGMRFQVRNALTAADLEPGLKIVIALFNDPGLAALAPAAPDVQFLAIGIPGIAAGGNVSVLGDATQVEIVGFLSGYTAAMLADDYRTGMLMPKDNNDAIRMFNSFANGMKYYCGLCRPYFFLPWSFPQYLEIPADEDPNNYDAYADILILQRKVGTLLVHPAIQTQDLVDYIGTTGVYMIGTVTPERRPAGWVMTIRPDTVKAIQTAWPQLLAGQGGVTVQAPLGLSDVDPSLLSPGRLRLVQQTLDDLQAGLIAP
ncbi:MAG: hypothetical protein OHK0041_20750 [Anaerolineales bacterium]